MQMMAKLDSITSMHLAGNSTWTQDTACSPLGANTNAGCSSVAVVVDCMQSIMSALLHNMGKMDV